MHQETVTLAYGISFIRATKILQGFHMENQGISFIRAKNIQGFHMENQEVTGVLRQTKTTSTRI